MLTGDNLIANTKTFLLIRNATFHTSDVSLSLVSTYVDAILKATNVEEDIKLWFKREMAPILNKGLDAMEDMPPSMSQLQEINCQNWENFLVSLARVIKPYLKLTRRDQAFNFFFFNFIHYFGKFLDFEIMIAFFENGLFELGSVLLASIVLEHVWQAWDSYKSCTAKVSVGHRFAKAVLGLLGLGPLANAFAVWRGDDYDPDKHNAGPILQLKNTGMINLLASTIPENIVQVGAYLTYLTGLTSQSSQYQTIALLFSTIKLGYFISKGNLTTETSWSRFWSGFSLYGYICNETHSTLGIKHKRYGMILGQMLLNSGYFSLFVWSTNIFVSYFEAVWPLAVIFLLEFLLFCGYKIVHGEMWHPGPVVAHSPFNDYVSGAIDKVPLFVACMTVVSFPNRDPRRVTPHLFFYCFLYRCIASNALIGYILIGHTPEAFDSTSPLYQVFIIWLISNISILLGWLLILLCTNKDYDKAWYFGKTYNGRTLYADIFREDRCYTKFLDKDAERAFCCRTRHAIWMNCELVENWICETLVHRFANKDLERPKWLAEKFRTRIISIFGYHHRNTTRVSTALDLLLTALPPDLGKKTELPNDTSSDTKITPIMNTDTQSSQTATHKTITTQPSDNSSDQAAAHTMPSLSNLIRRSMSKPSDRTAVSVANTQDSTPIPGAISSTARKYQA